MKNIFLLILIVLSVSVYSQVDTIYQLNNLSDTVVMINDIDIVNMNRASERMPITEKTLNRKDVKLLTIQQDIPSALSYTPSVLTHSDNGGLSGYTYMRLRGVDQTRINMTLNGVPLNEPEDQGVYFSNYPDFINSINSLQIQRGVGTTNNGTSSYIGSINFESIGLNSKKENHIGIEFGGYNSYMLYAETNNKLKNIPIYFRVSSSGGDGYKYNSMNKSYSMFLNTGYKWDKSLLKFVSFFGHQKNQMSWLGAPIDSINNDRRYNTHFDNERDDFKQNHNQLHYIYYFNNKLKLSNTLYYNYLNGNYDFDLNAFLLLPRNTIDSSFYNYALESHFIGAMSNLSYTLENFKLYSGIHANKYNREHSGSEAKIGDMYLNNGYKNELSLFTKVVYIIGDFNLFGDIQYRYTDFDYIDSNENGVSIDKQTWKFINPKIGVSYISNNNKIYYTLGQTYREPTRTDLLGGDEHLWSPEQFTNIEPESVIDNELGYIYKSNELLIAINGYYMSFSNEIVLNGQVGSNSLPLHVNAAKSRRYGLESDIVYHFNGITIGNNISLSKNEIIEDGNITNHVMSPSFITNSFISYKTDIIVFKINHRYQSSSYIDYENKYKIGDFHTIDFRIMIEPKNNNLSYGASIKNLTNTEYFSYGQMAYDGLTPLYHVGMPRYFNLFLIFKF